MLIVPSSAENVLADLIVAAATKIKLFKNNVTPSASTVVGDLTEADYAGYTYESLTWGSATQVSAKGTAVADDVAFEASSGSQTIYGYWVTKTDNTLLWVERFATAKTIDSSNPITISAKFTLSSEA